MGRVDIISTKLHTAGRWLVTYNIYSPCECSFERKMIVINRKSEPSQTAIIEAIEKQKNQKK